MTVLVVDDDASAREYARSLLEGSGFSVAEAADGEAALEKVNRSMPECIVLDLVMPGLSGFDTLRTLRKDHPDFGARDRAYQHGWGRDPHLCDKVNKADAFVTKTKLDDPVEGLMPHVRRLTRG